MSSLNSYKIYNIVKHKVKVKAISRKRIIGFVVILVVGIILISFGIYLISCCSWVDSQSIELYHFVRYFAGNKILIGIGGTLIGLDLIGGLYLVWKSMCSKGEKSSF